MLTDNTADAIARAFVLGTGRTPAPVAKALPQLKGDPKAELTALALVGQRLRFRKLAPDRGLDPMPAPAADPRQEVPQAVRPLLRRLITAKTGATDLASLAIADAMARRRLRLHVFDLPRFDAFVQHHAELLGASAVAWAARRDKTDTPVMVNEYIEPDIVDESNWQQAVPTARAAFIRQLRSNDAARARDLVAAALPSQPAAIRLRLVAALSPGLSPADRVFLESLAGDRAPTVRDTAQALLARIPGTEAAGARLAELVGRITVSRSLLGRLKLGFTYPATAPTKQANFQPQDWAAQHLLPVDLQALAAALGHPIAKLIAGARDDAVLTLFFARQCMLEARHDLLAEMVRKGNAEESWRAVIAAAPEAEQEWASPDWARAALAPELWTALPHTAWLVRLYQVMRAPLPAETAAALLACKAWQAELAKAAQDEAPFAPAIALAALVPNAGRARLRVALAALPARDITRAQSLLDALDLIDPA